MTAPTVPAPTRIRGVILDSRQPSRNNRLYTGPCLARMVERARPALSTSSLPLKASHSPDDDALRVVGRVTAVELTDDGTQAVASAELVPTTAGRDAAVLASSGVVSWSIEAVPCVPPVRETLNGSPVDVYTDVELVAIALTPFPGVQTARFATERARRGVIMESAEAHVVDLAAVDLTQLGPSGLRKVLGAALAAAPPPVQTASLPPDASPGTILAAQLRQERDELIRRQHAAWLQRS